MDLPFKEVGELIELRGEKCDFKEANRDDSNRWFLIQASGFVNRPSLNGGECSYNVMPTHIIGFSTYPGEGSEPANFGLCRYPTQIEVTKPGCSSDRKMTIRTRMPGWSWASFCKTQYACNPECGGVANFLRCHLSVVRLLDKAKSLGILREVYDEGDFWEHRDVAALAKNVCEWNEAIAAIVGTMKDQIGGDCDAPITKFPNFEHLEADGCKKTIPLCEMLKKADKKA